MTDDVLTEDMRELREIVAEQAEDALLWAPATTAQSALLQQELRRLHVAIESSTRRIGISIALPRRWIEE